MSNEANFSGDEMQEVAAPTSETVHDANPSHANEERIPLAALQEERAKRQQMAEELQMMKEHISLLQSSQKQIQQEKKDPFDSLDDNDIPTMRDIKNLFNERERKYQNRLSEMQMAQRHPDYSEVISKYLPEVIKQNPSLTKEFQKEDPNYELAYYLAKNSDAYRNATKKTQKNEAAERVIQNSQMAGSLSSMGTTSPINAAKRYREMSDSDFQKEMDKNLGYV